MLAYAPMSNGRPERIIGTLKRAAHKVFIGLGSSSSTWEAAIPTTVYGYRRRPSAGGCSPFQLLYGVPPRMTPLDQLLPFPTANLSYRKMELIHVAAVRAERSHAQGRSVPTGKRWDIRFPVDEELLVPKGASLGSVGKWPPFKSRFYGPCTDVRARHPRYTLVSHHNRYTRQGVHAKRLIRYKTKPEHLL